MQKDKNNTKSLNIQFIGLLFLVYIVFIRNFK